MRFVEFEKTLATAKGVKPPAPKPLYLFYGDEAWFKHAGVQRLRTVLRLKDREARFDGTESTLDLVLDEVFTLPFFGTGTKLVVIDNPEALFAKSEAGLKKAFAHPPATAVTALVAAKLPSHSKLIKWADQVGAAVECKHLEEDDRVAWVIQRAKASGMPIEPAAARLLVQRVDGDLNCLAGHVEKLSLYASGRKEIARADVEAVVGIDREYEVFDLVNAVAARQRPRAIEVLHTLLRDAEGVEGLMGALAWQLRRFLQAELSLDSGVPRADVADKLRLRGGWEKEFFARLAAFKPGELRRKHRMLGRFDLMAKTSAMPRETLAELLVVQLMEA